MTPSSVSSVVSSITRRRLSLRRVGALGLPPMKARICLHLSGGVMVISPWTLLSLLILTPFGLDRVASAGLDSTTTVEPSPAGVTRPFSYYAWLLLGTFE